MNCYECGASAATQRPAEAVCRTCGAAMCADHTWIARHEEYRPAGLGTSRRSVTRAMVCPSCAPAGAEAPAREPAEVRARQDRTAVPATR
ncbi:DUF2180 family protein [Streptomyces wuyuanensis]|uniref:DUF2180 family protein n=1 Tax=Streptomyces wuyuanensis TaxID=1196353 RepID=UPI003440A4A8